MAASAGMYYKLLICGVVGGKEGDRLKLRSSYFSAPLQGAAANKFLSRVWTSTSTTQSHRKIARTITQDGGGTEEAAWYVTFLCILLVPANIPQNSSWAPVPRPAQPSSPSPTPKSAGPSWQAPVRTTSSQTPSKT